MRNKKTFTGPDSIVVSSEPTANGEAADLIIPLPENPTSSRTINLTPWLGRGIDGWVWACAGQLRSLLSGGKVQASTVGNYWHNGLVYFFNYLVETRGPGEPLKLMPVHMRNYISWLKDHNDWCDVTQKTCYDATKSVLMALRQRSVVPAHPDLFPANPFPGCNSKAVGETPLSLSERERFVQALRDDLVAIHKGQFAGCGSDAIVVHVLAIAVRTGINTTPLLEMSRDCLRPHPWPGMMRIETFKRRGNATHRHNLRFSRQDQQDIPVPMDGVAVLRMALKTTEQLVAEAKAAHKDRIWLYRSESDANTDTGTVKALSGKQLGYGINSVIARHSLKDDAGEPLRINLSRLRKTMENRLYLSSGGNVIAVAALMGHTPKVADTHYLACTQQMLENATFVGEALPDIYRQGISSVESGKVIPLLPGKTPVGRCKDPYHGDKAPKDGGPCDNFFSCFTCTSYAIVGSPEDLHRLFSFYWFLGREMHTTRSNFWREQFRITMNLIDAFTQDKFDAELVRAAKERARVEPLKFWFSYTFMESADV